MLSILTGVIGADTHKRTHALAAVDASTGQLLGEREIAATEHVPWNELEAPIIGVSAQTRP
jgi:hypothetical protein